MLRSNLWTIALAVVVGVQTLLLGKLLYGSPSAVTEGLSMSLAKKLPSAAVKPSKLTDVPGSKLKRVTLTPLAAKRIGLKTATISEQQVLRTLVMPGELMNGMTSAKSVSTDADGSKAVQPASGDRNLVVRVDFLGDVGILDREQPVSVSALNGTGPSFSGRLMPHDVGGRGATKVAAYHRSALHHQLSYAIEGAGGGLEPGSRVRVEIPRSGSKVLRKVIPYSAILYDAFGSAWVYVQQAELTFFRQRVEIDFIKDGLAVLKSGPLPGTPIVTSGSTLLWGAELGK